MSDFCPKFILIILKTDAMGRKFYTSYVGNARSASITVEFDDDLIENYIADKDYTGNEYKEYIAEREMKDSETDTDDSAVKGE